MNRNKLFLLNVVVVVITTIINTIFGMIEISLFISHYGSEINGLLQTGNQVLGYLSLIEAGICSAYLFNMYKYEANHDYLKLASLYKSFKKSMSTVVNKMLICAFLISLIYPLFLSKKIEYFYVFLLFLLLSIKAILPYRVTLVPKYMIVLKEQKYKAEFISGISKSITYIIEIILIVTFDIGIYLLIFVCIGITLLTGYGFHIVMKKLYKNTLNIDVHADDSPKAMSKDILIHNISRLIFSSTDNIILSILGTLNAVTIYSSYNIIVGQVIDLANRFLDGTSASMGIKIANVDKNSHEIYREILVGTFWAADIITSIFIVMINDFVEIWIGAEYCISAINIVLFGIIMFCGILLPSIQVARNACGLYRESRNFTIAQSVMNLVVTICLVPHLGITGALLGTVLARIIITIPFNYFLVDKQVFPAYDSKWPEIIENIVITALLTIILKMISYMIKVRFDSILFDFFLKTFIITVISSALLTLYYWMKKREFKLLVSRIVNLIFGGRSGEHITERK